MNRPIGRAETLTMEDVKALQAMSLEDKIQLSTWGKMYEWYEACSNAGLGVYISFSGGKDSTVLAHLVATLLSVAKNLPKDLHLVFSDTGLEYPEIREFAKWFATVWLPERFKELRIHYHVVRPKMNFNEVVRRYGYPLVSKEIAQKVHDINHHKEWAYSTHVLCIKKDGTPSNRRPFPKKWLFLIEDGCDIDVGAYCCNAMKKSPLASFQRINAMVPILGTTAEESQLRMATWMKQGCNAYTSKRPASNPLSFWKNQDILRYIVENELPICSVYGDIVSSDGENDYETTLIDCPLKCTGCQRTGCIFCGFGAHLEERPNRFERLKLTHPQIYRYAMGGGAYDIIDNRWKPTAKGLGMDHALDVVGVAH